MRAATSNADEFSSVVRYDRTGGPSSAYDFGVGRSPSEPVFVPRDAGAAEDDGFVLCTSYDGPSASTYLNVFDASDLGSGPIGRAHLEHRLPHGFHGNFAGGVV